MKGQIAKEVQKALLKVKHVSPLVLTLLAVGGVVGTAVLSSKAAIETQKKIQKEEDLAERVLSSKEKAKIAIRQYIPTVGVAAGTILCCTGANALNAKRIGSLTAAYAVLTKSYNQLDKKSRELFGEEGYEKLKKAITLENLSSKLDENDISESVKSGETKLYCESLSGELFETTEANIIEAEYAVNRAMAKNGYVSLNTFRNELGLEPTDMGDELGWSYGIGADFYGYQWIDFRHHRYELEDGLEAISIEYPYTPVQGFME